MIGSSCEHERKIGGSDICLDCLKPLIPLLKEHEKAERAKKRARAKRQKVIQKYGLTVEQYEEMLERQGGRCAICREPPSKNRSLAVDHCHKTGKIRGLLCQMCNVAVGCLKDSLDLCIAAYAYLHDNQPDSAVVQR